MNWMNTKEFRPPLRIKILAYAKDSIYIGEFYLIESYNSRSIDGQIWRKDLEVKIIFHPEIWIDHPSCEACPKDSSQCSGYCVDCCEKEYEISQSYPSFDVDEVTHWMPLPENPKDEDNK